MEEMPNQILLAVAKQILDGAKITDKTIIDTFTVGFIAGAKFIQQNN
jgi:hypothetical protein